MMVIHLLFIYSTNISCCYYVPGAVPGTKKMVPPSPMALYPGRLRETAKHIGKYDKARFGEKCFWRSSSSNAEAVNLRRAWQVRGQKEDQFGHL